MKIFSSRMYLEDLDYICRYIDVKALREKKVLITGVTGMIGSMLADAFLKCGVVEVYGVGRSKKRAEERFGDSEKWKRFHFIEHNVIDPFRSNEKFDFIIHAASNAYPKMFDQDPVGTMLANFNGLYNLLEFAKGSESRIVYISSGEVYGQGDGSDFVENNYGFVDITDPRSCYPSAKRAAETLCVAYKKQYSVNVSIARLSHTYGPTATNADTRAATQFIQNGVDGKPIIMKSRGEQIRSYTYIADAVAAIICIMLRGENGEAYNVAYDGGIVSIYEMAKLVSSICNVEIQFAFPDLREKKSYNPVLRSVLSSKKIKEIGFEGHYDIKMGLWRTIQIKKDAH